MADRNPVVGPEGLASSISSLSQQVSAVERASDLKVEALRREWMAELVSVRSQLEAAAARFDEQILQRWQNHTAIHDAAHGAASEALAAYQRSSDALTEVRRREAEEKLDCLRRDTDLDIRRIDALIAAEVKTIVGVIDERDRLYSTQFKASEIAVGVGLAASEKAVNAAFAASEKAAAKAEGAQKDLNDRSNDLQRQYEDQFKAQMPRQEAIGAFKNIEDKFVFVQQAYDAKLDAIRISHEKIFDAVTQDVAGLRESRSEGAGRGIGANQLWGYIAGAVGIAIALYKTLGG